MPANPNGSPLFYLSEAWTCPECDETRRIESHNPTTRQKVRDRHKCDPERLKNAARSRRLVAASVRSTGEAPEPVR